MIKLIVLLAPLIWNLIIRYIYHRENLVYDKYEEILVRLLFVIAVSWMDALWLDSPHIIKTALLVSSIHFAFYRPIVNVIEGKAINYLKPDHILKKINSTLVPIVRVLAFAIGVIIYTY